MQKNGNLRQWTGDYVHALATVHRWTCTNKERTHYCNNNNIYPHLQYSVSPEGLHLKVCRFCNPVDSQNPQNTLSNLNFSGNNKKLYCFPLWSWKSDILEVQGLPLRVATRSHRSHSIYRNKLINHWYSYLPQTFNVLHSQGWQCDQKVRVVLQTVSDPTVACPPPV